MSVMQTLFNNFQNDVDVQANVNTINAMVGTDYGWLPTELQEKINAVTAIPALENNVATIAGPSEQE